MTDLESLGFLVRHAHTDTPGEKRTIVYLEGFFVAWFRSLKTTVNEKKVVDVSEECVSGKKLAVQLTDEQTSAIEAWFGEQRHHYAEA